jgi:Cu/Ag efflux protein CusF
LHVTGASLFQKEGSEYNAALPERQRTTPPGIAVSQRHQHTSHHTIFDYPEPMGEPMMTQFRTTSAMIMLAGLLWGMFAIPGLQAGEWGPYETEGTVLGIMPEEGLILVDHEPIRAPGYFMGKMEMPFSVSDPALMNGLKVGDRVHFRVSEEKKSRIMDIKKLP